MIAPHHPLYSTERPRTAAPRILPFHFLHDPHDSTRGHTVGGGRDSLSMGKMWKACLLLGYEMGEQLVNHPDLCEPVRPDAANRLPRVPIHADPGDVVMTVTRIVTHYDVEREEKRGSQPSGTDLEHRLAVCWRRYFRLFTRTTTWLVPEMEELLFDGFENRQHIVFRQSRRKDSDEREACFYRDLSYRPYRNEPRTAVFLLRLSEIWEGGPGYIGIAGMTGRATLAWAHLLSTQMLDLLREPVFAMVELSNSPTADRNPDPLGADGWEPRVILHHRLA